MLQKGLDLRTVEEIPVLFVVVKGLDAEDIPGAEELLLCLIPDDKGEHPPKFLQKLRAVFLVAVEQHLRVGGGLEDVAFFDQLFPQLPEVVDLAVEGEDLGAVLVEDRLGAAFQVDDGQPPEPHRDAFVHIVVVLVGPAVDNLVGHGLDDGQTVALKAVCGKAGKAAHRYQILSIGVIA